LKILRFQAEGVSELVSVNRVERKGDEKGSGIHWNKLRNPPEPHQSEREEEVIADNERFECSCQLPDEGGIRDMSSTAKPNSRPR